MTIDISLRHLVKYTVLFSLLLGTTGIARGEDNGKKEIFVDVPNLCIGVDKVEADNVYLTTKKTGCEPFESKIMTKVDRDIATVHVYIDGELWKDQKAEGFDTGMVGGVEKRSKDQYGDFQVNEKEYKEKGMADAQVLDDLYESQEVQDRIQQETDNLKKTVFADEFKSLPTGSEDGAGKMPSGLRQDERIYIFVSSSIPLSTLRSYVQAVARIGDPNIFMVFNGFIGGAKNWKPTMDYISSITVKNPGCNTKAERCDSYLANIEIDPLLFGKYGVNKVPTVVYATGVQMAGGAGASEGKADVSYVSSYSVSGDASLEYILEYLFKETNSDSIENITAKLEQSFYQPSQRAHALKSKVVNDDDN